MTSSARIVVTGLGAVTPHGVGVDVFWRGIIENRSAVRATEDPVLQPWAPVVANVPDFNPSDFLARKTVRDTARFSQMALVAAMEAVRDAGLAAEEGWNPQTRADRTGIFMGTSFGSIRNMDDAATDLAKDAHARVEPRLVSKSIPNAAGSSVAIHFDIEGPVLTYTTACASSANSIGEAATWLQSGRLDVALAGGSDCLFASTLLAGLRASGALVSHGPEDLSTWSRPFDVDRSGMVMGEGAAVLVLEPLERALARGARIYAELVGYGTSNDAFHQIAPHPEGTGAVAAMKMALAQAGIKPSEVDYINAHATSTKAGDTAEIKALTQLFGESLDHIPVSSIKGSIGHLLGAAGGVESLACVKAIETGWLPPNLHCENPEEGTPKNLVHEARPQAIRFALSNSFGFGGQNGVLLWKRYEA
ncbi:MAG: beta-ketoacyl-[acyl-carrier-protein] synthase family protein [Alicyclobacillus macrosporangiidus]|uniref:beta-ketoacyl-[acyl-carrier-protein] synthase family protein n=1 Tax=Alicyclobacillus TaxID=29330 RepID=UPI00047A917D|nr:MULTISPECIES: beta-ketoacyl-[acyl-carrier-protein] synthase family protein [Alicyclobacillus]MCL6597875.1 beta-ketoacyl-[acyl-carrier-protein] synthase family protein [Alicyclobacillus macrosporangiidus]